MAVVAFDPLEYAQQLEAAGMTRAQAEVVAKGLCSMFVHNFDALVTKDYLDVRLEQSETRIESKMDRRFAESQSKIDRRIEGIQSQMDERFFSVGSRFDRLEARMGRMELVQALILAALVIPVAQTLLTWWG